MKISIHTTTDLPTIFAINPNHYDGKYIDKVPGGISYRHMYGKILELGTIVSHVTGENQLSLNNISSPEAFVRLMSQQCRSLLTVGYEQWLETHLSWLDSKMSTVDEVTDITVDIDCIHINNTWYNILDRYYGMKFTDLGNNHYSMKWEVKDHCYNVINTLYFVMMLLSSRSGTSYVHEDQIAKAIRQVPSMPYFCAYLAGHHLIRSPKQFEDLKSTMESKVEGDVSLVQGNTHDLRIKTITSKLDMNRPILDIGCGEFKYAKKVSRKFKSTYYAMDLEENLKEFLFLKDKCKMDIHFTTDLDEYMFTEPVQVIISEVIEHMTEEALESLLSYLKTIPVYSIQVSCPNIAFNINYGLEGFRRDDHLREYTLEEFKIFVEKLPFHRSHLHIEGIGDTVNNNQPTHYAYTK